MNIFQDLKNQYTNNGIVQKLIFWNIGIFLLTIVFFYNFKSGAFSFPKWLVLYSTFSDVATKPWTLISYMFVHSDFIHLLFNMLTLHFVSRFFLTFFTEKQYLVVYLLGGIFAGFVFVLIYYFLGITVPVVGASGAIMTLLVAATTYSPYYILQIPLIGRIKLWHITALVLFIDILQLLLVNTGGHIVHLSGAFFGFLYVFLLKRGTDLAKPFSNLSFKRPVKKKTPFSRVHVNKPSSNLSKVAKTDVEQKKVDDILDKISKSGYDSLTKEEKEFLFKLGK
ncbi:rhomboid family intramembrane serine protease [uncultured Flavobacterium sp.]|uniref:rhomboid family intramembrane serine protease n=1 Tax=uncultured Flavobacterium sp. TaxID=165435 RepID=UPI0030EC751B|tara:strand:- start:154072 stop:154914 length:843 start_codon:yes stop_codon:yes gene_type:complete